MADGSSSLFNRWRVRWARRPAINRHESFLVYQGGFYFKLAAALCLACILLYAYHDPIEGRSGSTWLGYSLGILGAGLIVWLAWFGARKRQFKEGLAPVQAWVSAHVYLGLSLILIATLHTAFQVGWNVHTVAYVLMLLVIGSGIYGIFAYSILPSRITETRNQMEFLSMVAEVNELNQAALSLADKIDAETHATVARSVSRAKIGGSAWEQITGRYGKDGDSLKLDQFVKDKIGQIERGRFLAREQPQRQGTETIMFVADQMFDGRSEKSKETLRKLLQTIAKRNGIVARVNRDITLRARLSAWLYVHVPLTVALLVALISHVLSVFLYW